MYGLINVSFYVILFKHAPLLITIDLGFICFLSVGLGSVSSKDSYIVML